MEPGTDRLRVGEIGIKPGVVPDEVGLGEAGGVAEAVRLARRPADDLEQRRALADRVGQVGGMAGRALLLEQRRSVRRLGGGQRHLRAGHRSRQAARRKIPARLPVSCAASSCAHRWRAQTVGRGKSAVVVAGCFTTEQKRPRSQAGFSIFRSQVRKVPVAAYAVGPWPRIRKMTPKSLHDHHTARLAWRARRSRIMTDPAMSMFGT